MLAVGREANKRRIQEMDWMSFPLICGNAVLRVFLRNFIHNLTRNHRNAIVAIQEAQGFAQFDFNVEFRNSNRPSHTPIWPDSNNRDLMYLFPLRLASLDMWRGIVPPVVIRILINIASVFWLALLKTR